MGQPESVYWDHAVRSVGKRKLSNWPESFQRLLTFRRDLLQRQSQTRTIATNLAKRSQVHWPKYLSRNPADYVMLFLRLRYQQLHARWSCRKLAHGNRLQRYWRHWITDSKTQRLHDVNAPSFSWQNVQDYRDRFSLARSLVVELIGFLVRLVYSEENAHSWGRLS